MVRGIESAANGMMAIQEWNDVIANNLANINTPGFKNSTLIFKNIEDMAMNQRSRISDESVYIGSLSAGGVVDAVLLDMNQGSLRITGNPLDLALSGKGFFAVQTPEGVAYTRNGSFLKNSEGIITTVDGYPLLGENGPINLNLDGRSLKDININEDGTVYINKIQIDKIRVVDFDNPQNLQNIGNSLFEPSDNQDSKPSFNYQIDQGSLEQANSNVIECMTNSINGSRTYEALAKIIQSENKTLNKAVTQVGRVKR